MSLQNGTNGMKRGRKKKEIASDERFNSVFAYRLRELFKSGSTSQEKTAAALNITRQTFGNWLNGRFQPDMDAVLRLADYYDVSVDYLLGRTKVRPLDNKMIAACSETDLTEDAVRTLSAMEDDQAADVLSDMITDPEFGRLMELIRTKINDDDRVIEYGEGDEAVTARQSDIIDFNIGKVIGSMCDRIRENRQNETVREIIPDEAPAIEKTVSRELTQEEYEDMLDDLNNGLYNYNPYAYDQN